LDLRTTRRLRAGGSHLAVRISRLCN